MRDHKKLRAFELADNPALAVYQATRNFPRDEQFGLTAPMRRAAVSVASNIVEGCARHTEADYLRFLDIAYGSICELEYQLSLATQLKFMKPGVGLKVADVAAEAARVLNELIRSFRLN